MSGHVVSPLRPMTVADLDAVLRVQREGAIAGLGHIFDQTRFPFPTEVVRHRWATEIAEEGIDCFVIVDRSGAVAGFAAIRGAELLHFGTALATWGTGLAGAAHDALLALLRAAGHTETRLRVFEANHRARRFYERRGWVAAGDRTTTSFPPRPVLLGYARVLP